MIPTQINPSYLFWVFSKVFNCDRPTWAVLYTSLWSLPTWASFGPSWYKLLTVLWFPLKLILVIYFEFLVRFLIVIDQLGLCCTQVCGVDQLGLALAQVGIKPLTVLWFPLKFILVIYFEFLVRFLIAIDQLGLCCTQVCGVDQLGLALAQVGISY